MKTHNLYTILIIAVMLVASCKEEEEGIPRQTTETYIYSQNLRGSEGVTGELPLPDLILTDVVGTDVANNLGIADLQLADSYLEISGLNQVESPDTTAIVLKDFTISVGTRPGVNLGDCSTNPQDFNEFAADERQSGNEVVRLIQNIFADLTSGNQRAKITVSFMPNVNITSTDNVQLVIHFGGVFHYVEYE